MKKINNFSELNTVLIKHYNCFNTERFFLDEFSESKKFVSIVSSSISDTCPFVLCRNIAKFIKKISIADSFPYIYVAPYAFKTDEL